jgi:hypothetical protein
VAAALRTLARQDSVTLPTLLLSVPARLRAATQSGSVALLALD